MSILSKIALAANKQKLKRYKRYQEKIPELEEMITDPKVWEKKQVLKAAWSFLGELKKLDPMKIKPKQFDKLKKFIEATQDEAFSQQVMDFVQSIMETLYGQIFSQLVPSAELMKQLVAEGNFNAAGLAGKTS